MNYFKKLWQGILYYGLLSVAMFAIVGIGTSQAAGFENLEDDEISDSYLYSESARSAFSVFDPQNSYIRVDNESIEADGKDVAIVEMGIRDQYNKPIIGREITMTVKEYFADGTSSMGSIKTTPTTAMLVGNEIFGIAKTSIYYDTVGKESKMMEVTYSLDGRLLDKSVNIFFENADLHSSDKKTDASTQYSLPYYNNFPYYGSNPWNIPTNQEKVTVNLKANPATVPKGSMTMLEWSSTGATYCFGYDGTSGWYGQKGTSGKQVITGISKDTNFKLVCRLRDGVESEQSVTVKVQEVIKPEVVTVNLKATPTRTPKGGSTTLEWSSTGATYCFAYDGWYGQKGTSGKQTITGISKDTNYKLVCRLRDGVESEKSVTVKTYIEQDYNNNIWLPDPEPEDMKVSLGGYDIDDKLVHGTLDLYDQKSVKLSWKIDNWDKSVKCNITNDQNRSSYSAIYNGKGETEFDISKTTKYTLTCYSKDMKYSDSLTARVNRKDNDNSGGGENNDPTTEKVTVDLKAVPSNVVRIGGSATLEWSSTGATYCFAYDGWYGERKTSGSEVIKNITKDTNYKLVCRLRDGVESEQSVTIRTYFNDNIIEPVPNNMSVSLGGYDIDNKLVHGTLDLYDQKDVKLSWKIDNWDKKDRCSITNDQNRSSYTIYDQKGETTFAIDKTTNYSLTCIANDQTYQDDLIVRVNRKDNDRPEDNDPDDVQDESEDITGSIDEIRCENKYSNDKKHSNFFSRYTDRYKNRVYISGNIDESNKSMRVEFYVNGGSKDGRYIGSTKSKNGRFEFDFNPLARIWSRNVEDINGEVSVYLVSNKTKEKILIGIQEYDCATTPVVVEPEGDDENDVDDNQPDNDKPEEEISKQVNLDFGIIDAKNQELLSSVNINSESDNPVISWRPENAAICIASGDWGNRNNNDDGKSASGGHETLYDLEKGTYEYTLTCYNADESDIVEKKVVVEVIEEVITPTEEIPTELNYKYEISKKSPDTLTLVAGGEGKILWVNLVNKGSEWINNSDSQKTYLETDPQGRESAFYTEYDNKGYLNWANKKLQRRGDSPIAKHDDEMSFGFVVTADSNLSSGEYKECFAPIYNDNGVLNTINSESNPICWTITVQNSDETTPIEPETPSSPHEPETPIAPPEPTPEPPKPEPANTVLPNPLIMTKTDIKDLSRGIPAYNMLIPNGWTTEGGVFTVSASQYGLGNGTQSKNKLIVKNSDEKVKLALIPEWKWADVSYNPILEQYYPEGTIINGIAPIRSKATPLSYFTDIAFPEMHPDVQNITLIEDISAKTNIVALANQHQIEANKLPFINNTYTGGAYIFSYTENGVKYKELAVTLIEDYGVNGGGLWGNKETVAFRAPADQFEDWGPVLNTMFGSVKLYESWIAKEVESQVDWANYVGELTESSNATRSKIANDMYNVFTNQEDYRNPHTGETEIGSNQYQYRWANESGNIIYTNDAGYNPNPDNSFHDVDRTYQLTPVVG